MKVRLILLLMLFGAFGINQSLAQTIAAGANHSIALDVNGDVVGWGGKNYNQCDVPDGLKGVVAISAGDKFSLALKDDGTVIAWGNNGFQQCNVPSRLTDVFAISAGSLFSVAVRNDGTAVAWGSNRSYQCNVPLGLRDVVAVSAGDRHAIALKDDGTVIAWGNNAHNQCNVPYELKGVVAVSAGAMYSIALKADGTLVTWGNTKKHECDVPEGLEDVIAVAAGGYHVLALKNDGTVVAWGSQLNNQCDVPYGLKDVVAISANRTHSLALRKDGTVVAWGRNNNNRCNVPEGLQAALPTKSEISFSNDPPILSIDPSTIRFTDINPNQSLAGNGALDAMDRAELSFIIENTGPGPGRNLYADVSISGATDGLAWVSPWTMPDIPPGASEEASSYTIFSDRKTVDGVIEVTIEVKEPNGFSPEPFKVEIETRAFRAPKLEVVDFTSSLSTWKPNTPIGLDILVQNTGIGTAHDLSVELTLPDAVNCYSNNTSVEVASLAPGETIPITYDMIVPRNFDQSRVQANLTVTETFGDYGTNWTHGFPFEGGTSNGAVVSIDAAAADGEVSTERAALIKNNSKPSDVTFNKTDKEHNITAVAVIGKMVTGCDGNSKSADELASYTENNVLAHYEVIERRHFEDLLNEHRLQMSGLTFEETLIEKGCIENAQGYLFVESGCLMGDEMIQLKLVHCESSDLVWSCTGVNATAKETLDKVSEELEK